MDRELIALGTSSAVPTRRRNHNGYVLRFDDVVLLFDPGEGTQRQATFAGAALARLTGICVTHFHGDHCLGLPGVIQSLSGLGVTRPIPVYHPAAGAVFLERLRFASDFVEVTPIVPVPIEADGVVATVGSSCTLRAAALDHRIPAVGYRLQEPDTRRFVPERLAAAGVSGPDVGRLAAQGVLDRPGGAVTVESVTEPRPGQSVAVVMDTRPCEAAVALAEGVDLLLIESTYLEADAALATEYGHLTARQAGAIAAAAGARSVVLTHFSPRYPDPAVFAQEAATAYTGPITVLEDLQRVRVPRRHDDPPGA